MFCSRERAGSTASRPLPRHVFRLTRAALAEPQRPDLSTAAAASNVVSAPQTDAGVPSIARPDRQQLFKGGTELLGGREVEERALKQCVELHERWQRQEKGPVLNKRWQGMLPQSQIWQMVPFTK